MRKQFFVFLVRWLLNSLALWIALRLLGGADYTDNNGANVFLLAGLVLSLVNAIIKPIVIVLALPAILLTLGLFMLVVNGLMVYIALQLVPHLEITFVNAILAGMILSLTNYLLSGLIDIQDEKMPRRTR